MKRVYWTGLKAKAQIPLPGGFIFRMHDYRPNPRYVRCLHSTQQRVFKQSGPQALPVESLIDGKPDQQHDRHWMPGHPFGDTGGRARMANSGNTQAVVSGNDGIGTGEVCLGAVRLLIAPSIAPQIMIQVRLAAIERINRVVQRQFTDRRKRNTHSSIPGSVRSL